MSTLYHYTTQSTLRTHTVGPGYTAMQPLQWVIPDSTTRNFTTSSDSWDTLVEWRTVVHDSYFYGSQFNVIFEITDLSGGNMDLRVQLVRYSADTGNEVSTSAWQEFDDAVGFHNVSITFSQANWGDDILAVRFQAQASGMMGQRGVRFRVNDPDCYVQAQIELPQTPSNFSVEPVEGEIQALAEWSSSQDSFLVERLSPGGSNHVIETTDQIRSHVFTDPIAVAAESQDGSLFAIRTNVPQVHLLDSDWNILETWNETTSSLAFSSDNQYLAMGNGDEGAKVIDLNTMGFVSLNQDVWEGSSQTVSLVKFVKNDEYLVIGHSEHTWDAGMTVVRTSDWALDSRPLPRHVTGAWEAPDGVHLVVNQVFTMNSVVPYMVVFDLSDWSEVASYSTGQTQSKSLGFGLSRDGSKIAFISDIGSNDPPSRLFVHNVSDWSLDDTYDIGNFQSGGSTTYGIRGLTAIDGVFAFYARGVGFYFFDIDTYDLDGPFADSPLLEWLEPFSPQYLTHLGAAFFFHPSSRLDYFITVDAHWGTRDYFSTSSTSVLDETTESGGHYRYRVKVDNDHFIDDTTWTEWEEIEFPLPSIKTESGEDLHHEGGDALLLDDDTVVYADVADASFEALDGLIEGDSSFTGVVLQATSAEEEVAAFDASMDAKASVTLGASVADVDFGGLDAEIVTEDRIVLQAQVADADVDALDGAVEAQRAVTLTASVAELDADALAGQMVELDSAYVRIDAEVADASFEGLDAEIEALIALGPMLRAGGAWTNATTTYRSGGQWGSMTHEVMSS